MWLLNYDLHDIHWVLVMMRAKPEAEYNIKIAKAILDVLSEPQVDNTIEDNIIRKRLRATEVFDREKTPWVFADNVYTYGWQTITDEKILSILKKGFEMLLEFASSGNFKRFEDLADALHNVPIYIAEERGDLKKASKIDFSYYNRRYFTDLFKKLTE